MQTKLETQHSVSFFKKPAFCLLFLLKKKKNITFFCLINKTLYYLF